MSTTIIKPGSIDTSGINTPLVSFDCIIDTDFGLLSLIDREYLDSSVFDIGFFNNHHKVRELVKVLYEREQKNPLSICIKDSNYDIESLYKEFMNDKYKDILKVSMITEIYNLLEQFKVSGEVKAQIVCSNEYEIECLKELPLFNQYPIILLDELSDISHYNQFFFRYIDDKYINRLSPYILGKTVYIINHKFNGVPYQGVYPTDSTKKLFENRNKLYMIDMYNIDKLQ